ncbi:urease accessory protein UreD [Shimia marina]|uniref:Urease accessory protein UreD n=1 Tax=Shimia marina TaxID=321267 RepID=A0A0P1ETS8_9RHOB|nr:urease accessory protein UreD [Shimia marina]CUH54023.1 Urease accessory protein UreD [Shimia marina]SFE16601.1 urease accessory protein [Shimia marina]
MQAIKKPTAVFGESAITALTHISCPEVAPEVANTPSTPAQPRAIGTAQIRSKQRDGKTVLDDLRLSGSSRVLFPHANYARGRSANLQAVLLNTAGGITGGDRFDVAAAAGTNSHLTLTTQAAERAYRSIGPKPGTLGTTLTLEENARLDWLPQETILFEGASLHRSLTINMAPNARFLMVEPVIFGRTAMGETLQSAHIFDRVTLHRHNRLLFADRVKLSKTVQAHLDRPTIAGGARAMATVLLAAPDADRHLDALRALLPETGGASVIRDGLLFARILAADSYALRQSLIPALTLLHGADLPRTWML